MASVNWLGRTLPEAPVIVRESQDKGDALTLSAHPLTKLFKRPNPYYSGSTLWKAFSLSWIIKGDVYFLKVRNALGDVIQLWYIPHWLIHPIAGSPEYVASYEYRPGDGKIYSIEVRDIVHFRDNIDPNNVVCGLSPLASLLREVFTDNEAANYSALMLKNSGVPPFIVTPASNPLGNPDVDAEAVKSAIIRRTQGDERGQPLVLTEGVTIHTLGVDPSKMALDAIRMIPESRVAAVIGIPIQVLGFTAALDHSALANVNAAERRAYDSYLTPLHRHIQEELNVQLLPDFQGSVNEYVIHDTSNVPALQEDTKLLSERKSNEYERGVITRREARAALGYGFSAAGNDKIDDVFLVARGVSIVHPGEEVTIAADIVQNAPKGLTVSETKGDEQTAATSHGNATVTVTKGLSKAEIDKLSHTTDSDIEAARVKWRERAPKRIRDIVDAEVRR